LQFLGTYIFAVIGIIVLLKIQSFMGMSPMLWVGNIHLQYLVPYWHQQLFLILDLIIDLCIFGSVVYGVFKFMQSMATRYTVVDDQLIIHLLTPFGMLQERLELYRVVDYEFNQSFLGMLCRFGTVSLRTNDVARPKLVMTGFRRGPEFLDILRQETERCRQLKGVREITMPVGRA
jgi:hypothetical protein